MYAYIYLSPSGKRLTCPLGKVSVGIATSAESLHERYMAPDPVIHSMDYVQSYHAGCHSHREDMQQIIGRKIISQHCLQGGRSCLRMAGTLVRNRSYAALAILRPLLSQLHVPLPSAENDDDHLSCETWRTLDFATKMPGVPSGRGCDSCRKQKKKVCCYYRRLSCEYAAEPRKVRSGKTRLLTLYSSWNHLSGSRATQVQIHHES